MAENTTNIVSQVIAALKTNGADISQLTPTDNPADTDLIELGGGKSVKFGVIRAIVQSAVTQLTQSDSVLNGKITTEATARQLADAAERAARVASEGTLAGGVNGIYTVWDTADPSSTVQSIVDDYGATFSEFLSGLIAEGEVVAGDVPLIITRNAEGTIVDCYVYMGDEESASLENLRNTNNYSSLSLADLQGRLAHGLATEKTARTSADTQLQTAITSEASSRSAADVELNRMINEHRRELHYLPDNFATEKALFTAAGTYTIGTQPIKPGALLLGCVDECWGVYQYVYFNDEVEISAQSEEAVQAVPASAPTIAPPAVKHNANIANPENWVRLATIEDVNAALDALNIYNFGTLELDFTNVNWASVIPQDNICPQIDGIFAAWEAGKKIVGRFVVTKRVQQDNSSSMVTQPFDSFTIDYGGEDSYTHNPSIRFHCLSADTSDTNIRVRSVRVYFSRYNSGEDLKYAYGSSAMSQIDLPPGLNVNDWTNRIGQRLTALEKNAPVVEITAEEVAALLPADESQIATLELDAEDEAGAGADQPATCEALERFRTRLREMRGRSVFKPKEVYNPNDYINSYEHE